MDIQTDHWARRKLLALIAKLRALLKRGLLL